MYLLDTNVVSEFRRKRPNGGVLAWLASVNDRDLHIAAVTIGEIQAGIEITRERDPGRAHEIAAWLDRILLTFDVVPMDARVFRRWAVLMHRTTQNLVGDAMIAATAAEHGLTVVTRNLRDFAAFDIPTFDPFARL